MQAGDQRLDSKLNPDGRPSGSPALWVMAIVGAALAAYFVISAVVGARRWAHPIPYWDMWDGHLSFWFELQDGNTAIWWELSNEHHLLLLKAIFWLDFQFFSGSTTFLVTVNLLLLSLAATVLGLLLLHYLRERTSSEFSWPAFTILLVPVITLPFAWMQGEEIVFPYHAQFLMNNAIPVTAFLFLGLAASPISTSQRRGSGFFWVGFTMTALSPWTSASGLLIPFIAAGLAWSISLTRRRVIALIVLGIVSVIVYSIDSPFLTGGGDGPLTNLLRSPAEVLRFWLMYLGGPWAHLTESMWIGGVAGAIFVGVTVFFIFCALRNHTHAVFGLSVAAFPVFALLAALVTAAGRVSFGTEQVSAIRYLTPMLVAWACLFILAAPTLYGWLLRKVPLAFVAVLLVPVLLLPEQRSAFTPPYERLHTRDTAALAISLNAPDTEAITPVYPISTDRPLELGLRALADGVGIFGRDPYASLASQLGSPAIGAGVQCSGWLDARTPLENSTWDRIDGWIYVEGELVESGVWALTDRSAQIVGWVDVGKPREDVLTEFPDATGLNGYSGYLDRQANSADLFVAGPNFRCTNPLTPAVP